MNNEIKSLISEVEALYEEIKYSDPDHPSVYYKWEKLSIMTDELDTMIEEANSGTYVYGETTVVVKYTIDRVCDGAYTITTIDGDVTEEVTVLDDGYIMCEYIYIGPKTFSLTDSGRLVLLEDSVDKIMSSNQSLEQSYEAFIRRGSKETYEELKPEFEYDHIPY